MSHMEGAIDHEIVKGVLSSQCCREKTDGFQGCKKCGAVGFYLERYSEEGYCEDCEIKHFPERFHGCICCRIPVPSCLIMCPNCKQGLDAYHKKELDLSCKQMIYYGRYTDYWRHHYAMKKMKPGDFIRYWEKPTITSSSDQLPRADSLSHISKRCNYQNEPPTDDSPQVPMYNKGEWPGFYMGNGVWKKLSYIPRSDENGITIEEPWRIFDENEFNY